jgi:hypothetical protein
MRRLTLRDRFGGWLVTGAPARSVSFALDLGSLLLFSLQRRVARR